MDYKMTQPRNKWLKHRHLACITGFYENLFYIIKNIHFDEHVHIQIHLGIPLYFTVTH